MNSTAANTRGTTNTTAPTVSSDELDRRLSTLIAAWTNHEALRAAGASFPELFEAAVKLDAARRFARS